jgi:predicted Rossmann fold flavoprotein
MDSTIDIAIIGAGAAGLAAAIFAAEQAGDSKRLDISLLDGATTIGAKILISGGGRCNVTHEVVTPADFTGTRHIVRHVLAAFDIDATKNWFVAMGVELKREETGKLFPVSDKARTVLQALLSRCRELGINICPGHRVSEVIPSSKVDRVASMERQSFLIRHVQGELQARQVILATGGRSLPRTGSDGFGWDLVRRCGHSVTTTVPALVPLVLEDTMFHHALSGLSQVVELTTVIDGRPVDRRTGSLLWTHFGVSGPVVMDASRFWTGAREKGVTVTLLCNVFPGMTQETLREWLSKQASMSPRRSLVNTLAQQVPERFADALCRWAACDSTVQLGQLPRGDRERLIGALTRLPLPVQRDRGWNYAEVTAGGVPLEEVDFRTMESKKVPGLYLIGEMLDCDGRIGGFNFQWAWATGFLAGHAAASHLLERCAS